MLWVAPESMRKEGVNVARGTLEIEMGSDKNNLGSIALLLIFKSIAPTSTLTRVGLLRVGTLIRPERLHFLTSLHCQGSRVLGWRGVC